jgi:uncharacterized repeat protein (TIGR03803 family)
MRSKRFLSGRRLTRRFSFLLPLAACLSLFASRPAQAQTYKVLHSFKGPTNDGKGPSAIVLEADGTFYGTACYGGRSYNGTVFRLSPTDKETILYNFLGGYGSCPDSLLAWNGAFYGTTANGGAYGGGAMFRLDTKGNEVVLYSFPAPRASSPVLSFVDRQGTFYGTTSWGGANSRGSIFKIDTTGKESDLYSFTGGTGGQNPGLGLARDEDGNLYGTFTLGGDSNCFCGAVFKLNTAGTLTILHTFTGGTDGATPYGGVIRDSSGNLAMVVRRRAVELSLWWIRLAKRKCCTAFPGRPMAQALMQTSCGTKLATFTALRAREAMPSAAFRTTVVESSSSWIRLAPRLFSTPSHRGTVRFLNS